MKTLTEYFIDGLRSTRLYEMAKNQSDCEDVVRSECTNILENLATINMMDDIEALIVEHSFIETMKWTDKKFKD